jgi:hypothetical protein
VSWDALLVPSTGRRDELAEWFAGQPEFQLEREGEVFNVLYENDATGVYCSFFYGEQEEGGEALSFTVNYVRPAFFARESFAVLCRVCAELDLQVVDQQGDETPAPCDAEALEQSWLEGNDLSVPAVAETAGESMPYLERERAFEWWEYARVKPRIEADFLASNYDVYSPNVMLVVDRSTDHVVRWVAWTDAIPFVVPACDVFVIGRPKRRLLGRRLEQGLAPSEAVLAALEPHLAPFDHGLRILKPEAAEAARPLFEALELAPLEPDRYEAISPDAFVDVPPNGAQRTA